MIAAGALARLPTTGVIPHCHFVILTSAKWRTNWRMGGGGVEFDRVNADQAVGLLARQNSVAKQNPHYFGKFQSREEAEKWIEKHRWLTEQAQEPEDGREEQSMGNNLRIDSFDPGDHQ